MMRRKMSSAIIEALEGRLLLSGTGAMAGIVYVDYNGNGIRDKNEPPASQVKVYASYKDSLDRAPFLGVTDFNGHFTIAGLPATSYEISVFPKNTDQAPVIVPAIAVIDVRAGKVTRVKIGIEDFPQLALDSSNEATAIQSRLDSNTGATDIVLGLDRNFYVNAPGHNSVLQISPTGGIKELPIPTPNTDIGSLFMGPDFNVWFTEPGANAIGSVSTAGTFNPSIAIPTPDSDPAGIAEGVDDNIWFTERAANKIGEIKSGSVTEYPVPTAASQPTAIALSGLNLWFIESNTNKIGKLNQDTDTISEYPLSAAQGSPENIVGGSDDEAWFTLDNPPGIGVITDNGDITVYPISTPGSAPLGIVNGLNGTLAFTDPGANAVGKITTNGQLSELPITSPDSKPDGVALNRDGSIWFVESGVPAIAIAGEVPRPVTEPAGKAKSLDLLDFTDPDPAGRRSQYVVTINWGDSRRIVGGAIKKKSPGVFSVTGKHRFKAAGTYIVSVTVIDLAGSTLTESVTVTVT